MVFTAVLAAIAVIAAMVTVPGGKAEAAEPTDFKPNTTLGENTGKAAEDTSWGPLVWAGAPIEGQTGKNTRAILRITWVGAGVWMLAWPFQ